MLNRVDVCGRVYSRRCVQLADGSKFVHFHEIRLFTCPPHPRYGEQLLDFASPWPTVEQRSFVFLAASVLHEARLALDPSQTQGIRISPFDGQLVPHLPSQLFG